MLLTPSSVRAACSVRCAPTQLVERPTYVGRHCLPCAALTATRCASSSVRRHGRYRSARPAMAEPVSCRPIRVYRGHGRPAPSSRVSSQRGWLAGMEPVSGLGSLRSSRVWRPRYRFFNTTCQPRPVCAGRSQTQTAVDSDPDFQTQTQTWTQAPSPDTDPESVQGPDPNVDADPDGARHGRTCLSGCGGAGVLPPLAPRASLPLSS